MPTFFQEKKGFFDGKQVKNKTWNYKYKSWRI